MNENEKLEDIEIVVTDEPQKAPDDKLVVANDMPEIVVADAEDAGSNDTDPQSAIEKLQKKLKKERELRKNAEHQAQIATYEAQKASYQVEDSNLTLVTNAIDTLRRDNEYLKAAYKESMSVGDYDRAAEIQEVMSGNSAKLLQLENGKNMMESKPRQPPQFEADPVERMASSLSPRSARWIRNNPQFATDPRLTQKMVAAHNLAMADGYKADSDDYFEFVEDILKVRAKNDDHDDQEDESALSEASMAKSRRTPPVAAPVSRSGQAPGTRPNVVRLTSEEREIARFNKMSDQEYARYKMQLQKEGKLPN
jgi:hypothetical protein